MDNNNKEKRFIMNEINDDGVIIYEILDTKTDSGYNIKIGTFYDINFATEYVNHLNDNDEKISFTLSDKLYKWVKNHSKKCKSHGAAGEHYEFTFFPTGIVEFQTVNCVVCNKKMDDEL